MLLRSCEVAKLLPKTHEASGNLLGNNFADGFWEVRSCEVDGPETWQLRNFAPKTEAAAMAIDRGDEFGLTWLLLRPLPESDQHPAPETIRMRRAIKALLRGYGIKVERITRVGPDGVRVDVPVSAEGDTK
jgi:hypothetical protein